MADGAGAERTPALTPALRYDPARMAPAPPAARRRRFRWTVAAIATLAALLFAEIAVRVAGAGPRAPRWSEYHFLRRDDVVWVGDPKHPPEIVWDGDPYGTLPAGARMTYPLNEAGFRGPLPPQGAPTVVVVGDSFTFGEGVEVEDTFVARTQHALAARRPAPPALVNTGVSGYGSAQEAARLPEWLAQFRPRAVVVVVTPNDPLEPWESPYPDERVTEQSGERPRGLALWHLARSALRARDEERQAIEWYHDLYFGTRRDRWLAAREHIAEMIATARRERIPIGIVFFPILLRLDERPMEPIAREIGAVAAQGGAPFLDLTDVLSQDAARALRVHPTDLHPNARAHERAAEALVPFVESLLEGP